jgi:hypothetical protein
MMADAPASTVVPMPVQPAVTPLTFEKLLAELIKRATSPDDVAHLKRWLNHRGADKTWNKIAKGPFNSDDAFIFAMLVLDLRRAAEEADVLNKEIAALDRRKKHAAPKARVRAIRKLTNNEITPQQYAVLNQRLRSPKFFDPLLSVHSDEEGTRRRTLFCRMLSDNPRHSTGQWHDAEVALLCEIALDCGDVTIEMVRSARRESTRKRRR